MTKLALAFGVLAFAVFSWVLLAANKQAQEREQWAKASSSDDLFFTAAGLRGQTFVIVESEPNSVNCDRYLDVLLHDSEVRAKIERVGFTQVSCGGETRSIR
jgi:hypothetical protein